MKDVITKSSARIDRAELTTVRVMARDTPSAVGVQSEAFEHGDEGYRHAKTPRS